MISNSKMKCLFLIRSIEDLLSEILGKKGSLDFGIVRISSAFEIRNPPPPP